MNYVRYHGGIVGVFAETLSELNLTNGQSINEDMFWKVIGFNTTLGSSECKELDPWLPIDENTPKNGEEILLCSMFDQAVCYWRDDEVMTGWTWGLENKFLNPIGWKKLSELPRPHKLLPENPK